MEQKIGKKSVSDGSKVGLQLNSLRAYAILLVTVLIVVIVCLNMFIFFQNSRQLAVSKGVSEIRMPLSLRAQDILIGLNQASSAQRGFLLSGKAFFVTERQQVWDERILPAMEVLKEVKNKLYIQENVKRIEQLEILLPQYQALQEEIEQKKIALVQDVEIQNYTNIDSLQSANLIEQLKANQVNHSLLIEMINNRVLPLQQEIRAEIAPLIKTQEDVLKQDVAELVSGIQFSRVVFFIISLSGVIIAILIAYFFIRRMRTSIEKPTHLLEMLSQGKLVDQVEATKDELNAVIQAGSRLSQNLAAASNFAKAIGEGDFQSDFKPASENDTLGNALVHMRDRLLEVAEEDKRRNWTTSGLAQIGGILREGNQQADQLYLNIIRFIVKYLNANQGGLFLLNDEDQEDVHLEMVSCYAYERQKFLQKRIELGEGLVGQAFAEKEPIFLTEVPEAYIQITSGLGDANPRCILISPLKVNEEVSGVIEIASFKVLEPYEVDFINRLSETIASAIASTKVAERTRHLLEETRQQAEEMRAQEEEMRQNNEELQATQELIMRKSMEAEERHAKLNAIMGATADAIITTDKEGIVDSANRAIERLFGYSEDDIVGKSISKIIQTDIHEQGSAASLISLLTDQKEAIGIHSNGSTFPMAISVTETEVEGRQIYTGILRDISEQKALESRLKHQLEEAKAQEEELRQNMEELSAIQESLAQKNKEIEAIRSTEKERAEQQIAARNKMMEKALEKFRLKEKDLLEQIQQKDQHIRELSQ
jgi:PAS domain S-box-containing protein